MSKEPFNSLQGWADIIVKDPANRGSTMKPSVQTYVYDRSTPGTHLYKEENGSRDQSGNLYVVKGVFSNGPADSVKPPNKIKVTIEAA